MRVLCTLRNASENINGVDFVATDGGMLSAEVSPEVAAGFLRVPGYVAVEDAEPEPAPEPEPEPAKRGPGRPPKTQP
jgi:hypothetical protein